MHRVRYKLTSRYFSRVPRIVIGVAGLLIWFGLSHKLISAEISSAYLEWPDATNANIPSWPKKKLHYKVIGNLSEDAQPAIETGLRRLSKYTDLSFDLGNPVDLLFIYDSGVVADLYDHPEKLKYLGLSSGQIASMQSKWRRPAAPGIDSCGSTYFSSASGDIIFFITLAQTVSARCLDESLSVSAGVHLPDGGNYAQALRMACVLYRTRESGRRTLSEIRAVGSGVLSGCNAM